MWTEKPFCCGHESLAIKTTSFKNKNHRILTRGLKNLCLKRLAMLWWRLMGWRDQVLITLTLSCALSDQIMAACTAQSQPYYLPSNQLPCSPHRPAFSMTLTKKKNKPMIENLYKDDEEDMTEIVGQFLKEPVTIPGSPRSPFCVTLCHHNDNEGPLWPKVLAHLRSIFIQGEGPLATCRWSWE